jgi:UDP-glucose 4-epimerase
VRNTVLITGGLGAIGFALASRLINQNFGSIYIMDNMSSGAHNADYIGNFIYCDIVNSEKIGVIIKKIAPTHVFHLAAHFANQNSVDFPLSDAQTNILGSINLFEGLRNVKNLKKVVYASSSCVYGHAPQMSETSQLTAFETPYAITKFVGELYAKYYSELHKIPAVSLRIFNTYGPGEAPGAYRNVIPNFINLALAGLPIKITGDGNETRDFTYVGDTVDLLLRAAASQFREGEIFNGGTGIETKISDLAELIIRLTGSRSEICYLPKRTWDQIPNRKSDNRKSKELLGYDPKIGLVDGLVPTIDWVRAWRSKQSGDLIKPVLPMKD